MDSGQFLLRGLRKVEPELCWTVTAYNSHFMVSKGGHKGHLCSFDDPKPVNGARTTFCPILLLFLI